MTPPAFAELAAGPCPGYAALALGLAGEFGSVDADTAEHALGRRAVELPAIADRPPLEQLDAVPAAIAATYSPPPRLPAGDRDLMLDAVLASRTGQPVMLAIIAAEIGPLAGARLGIVSDGRRHFVAHRDAPAPLLIDLTAPQSLHHAHTLQANLAWHCAHQVACALLQLLLCRALNAGDLNRAIRAAELKLALPFDAHTRQHARHDLHALRASLN